MIVGPVFFIADERSGQVTHLVFYVREEAEEQARKWNDRCVGLRPYVVYVSGPLDLMPAT